MPAFTKTLATILPPAAPLADRDIWPGLPGPRADRDFWLGLLGLQFLNEAEEETLCTEDDIVPGTDDVDVAGGPRDRSGCAGPWLGPPYDR